MNFCNMMMYQVQLTFDKVRRWGVVGKRVRRNCRINVYLFYELCKPAALAFCDELAVTSLSK